MSSTTSADHNHLAAAIAAGREAFNEAERLWSIDTDPTTARTPPKPEPYERDAIFEAGYRRPRMIRSVDELESMPEETVIVLQSGVAFQLTKSRDGVLSLTGTNETKPLIQGTIEYRAFLLTWLPATAVYIPE